MKPFYGLVSQKNQVIIEMWIIHLEISILLSKCCLSYRKMCIKRLYHCHGLTQEWQLSSMQMLARSLPHSGMGRRIGKQVKPMG